MASIERRNGRWRARWRTPEGESRSLTFARKVDAERHLTSIEHAKLSGAYVDPNAGKVTLGEYASAWCARQVWRESTASRNEIALRRQIVPVLGNRAMAAIRPSEVQAAVKTWSTTLKPSSVELVYRLLASVFKAAVLDRVVPSSPCVQVKLPTVTHPKVQPMSLAEVEALADGVMPRMRSMIILGAGSGLRLGEASGLTVDRVDFLRRTITVDRQLVTPAKGEPTFGPPKTPASNRVVPVGKVLIDELAAHIDAFGLGPDGLMFTNSKGSPWRRARASAAVTRGAIKAGRPSGHFHELRHHFASLLIGAGCSVKAVQDALGHANASETLDTYSHLWPADSDHVRDAIDRAWAAQDDTEADGADKASG